jgi:hypothetical protein
MKPSKVFKRETYVTENGVKMYAETRLEHNDVQAMVVFTDDNWKMISFHTLFGFKQFVEKNDFELINK